MEIGHYLDLAHSLRAMVPIYPLAICPCNNEYAELEWPLLLLPSLLPLH